MICFFLKLGLIYLSKSRPDLFPPKVYSDRNETYQMVRLLDITGE